MSDQEEKPNTEAVEASVPGPSGSELRNKLRARSKKRRELLAQSLGAGSVEGLTAVLGNSAERKALHASKLKAGSGTGGTPQVSDTGAFVVAKVAVKDPPPGHRRRPSKPEVKDASRVSPDRSDEDVEIEDVAKVLKAEEQYYKGSHTFLKGTQSANPHNDYSQHFVDTGQRPQNFIRDSGLAERFEEYPKLKELIKLKDELVSSTATPPMYLKCDLVDMDLAEIGSKFDVIIIEPPLEEYVQRSSSTRRDFWTWDMIQQLNIMAVADWRCFIWLWCGSGPEGLNMGRQCFKQWGFRRCEDICWIKTNVKNQEVRGHLDQRSLFQRSKEHCLMGIKGTVRRSVDGDFIHANVDIDLIISDEPESGSFEKPTEIFLIAEHFCLGRRRLHIFGRDDTIRPGWLTVGPELTSSNFDLQLFRSHLEREPGFKTGCTEKIENLRPKSPPPKTSNQAQDRSGQANAPPGTAPTTSQVMAPCFPPGTAAPPIGVTPSSRGAFGGGGVGRGRAGWGPGWQRRM